MRYINRHYLSIYLSIYLSLLLFLELVLWLNHGVLQRCIEYFVHELNQLIEILECLETKTCSDLPSLFIYSAVCKTSDTQIEVLMCVWSKTSDTQRLRC